MNARSDSLYYNDQGHKSVLPIDDQDLPIG